MARSKTAPDAPWVLAWERVNRENPIIGTRYFVVEVTPGYNTGGYYDTDIPEKRAIVSRYFDTREEAEEYMDTIIPEVGNHFYIAKQFKRRTVTERWWDA